MVKKAKIRIEFLEEILGSCSGNPKIHEEFISSKAPSPEKANEEVEALSADEMEKKEKTVFYRDDDGNPCLFDYQIKGFLKNAGRAYGYIPKLKLTAYKTKIDNLVFIDERKVTIHIPEGQTMDDCQRPLRADTAQGPRTALANSETCPAGSWCEFNVTLLDASLYPIFLEWMDYGRYNGIGQWHNSGKGRFKFEVLEESKIDFSDVLEHATA